MSFDYIIVGPARPAVCWRTASRPAAATVCCCWKPAGSDRRFFVQMPLGYGKIFYDKSLNWMYTAEPDRASTASAIIIRVGKILGGFVLDQRHGLYPRQRA